MKEWKFSVSYHRDGNTIRLLHVPFWVTALERMLDNKPTIWLATKFSVTYELFSKIIFWLDSKYEEIAEVPASKDLLTKLVPDDEWLWGEIDADSAGAGGNG